MATTSSPCIPQTVRDYLAAGKGVILLVIIFSQEYNPRLSKGSKTGTLLKISSRLGLPAWQGAHATCTGRGIDETLCS